MLLQHSLFDFTIPKCEGAKKTTVSIGDTPPPSSLTKVQKDKLRRHELGELFSKLSTVVLGRTNVERTRVLAEAINIINSQKEQIQQLQQTRENNGEPGLKRQKCSPSFANHSVELSAIEPFQLCDTKRKIPQHRQCSVKRSPGNLRSEMCLSNDPSMQHLALEVVQSSTLSCIWMDTPPSASSVWRPLPLPGYSSLGDYMNSSATSPSPSRCVSVRECMWDVGSDSWKPRFHTNDLSFSLLAHPTHFQLVWRSKEQPGVVGMSVYRPIPPKGYISMGDLCVPSLVNGVSGVPCPEDIRVVHESCVRSDQAQTKLAIVQETQAPRNALRDNHRDACQDPIFGLKSDDFDLGIIPGMGMMGSEFEF